MLLQISMLIRVSLWVLQAVNSSFQDFLTFQSIPHTAKRFFQNANLNLVPRSEWPCPTPLSKLILFRSFLQPQPCGPFSPLSEVSVVAQSWHRLLPGPGMLPPLPRLTLPEPSAHGSAATSSWKPSQTSPLGSVWLHPTFLLLVTSYSHFVPVNIQLMFLFPSSTVSFTRAKLRLRVLPFGPQLLGQCLEYIRHSINSGGWFQFPCLPVILYRALLGIFPD